MGRIRITGMNSGLDTDSMVKELVNAYEKQGEKYTKAKTKTEWKQEAWTVLNNKIKSFFSKQAGNMRFSSAYSKKSTTVSDSTKASVVTSSNAVNGSQTLKVNKLAAAGYLTGAKLEKTSGEVTKDTTLAELGYNLDDTVLKIGKGVKKNGTYTEGYVTPNIAISKNMTLKQFTDQVSAAGYNANFDESTGRLFISSKESGAKNDFTIEADSSDPNSAVALEKLGLKVTDAEGGAYMTHGSDAEIELNGAKFNSASNTFSINGLTITAKEVTSGTISLVTDTDYNEIYYNIKNFIKEYSSLMNEMDKLYNAASSKGYEPLTSEEKDAMTDDEIEKWEKKIKDSLLKGDSELDTVSSAMRNAMLSTFNIDGKTYSLSSFGIHTLGYFDSADNEKNAYHIDGNKDDPDTAGNEDRLRAMIASNPDATATFFQKLSQNLYDAMNKIQSTSDNYKSFGNFFSDKKLQNEYVDQEKQVKKWEDYVAKQEDKYYKQFTAMESAMSSLNSQQSYISQLFAG
ncbi:MAG: flagellar filament capping protein FliD [Lachnospiraceae bacterium]|nr:flagellar filament capping protein FliD [Lachnospiraceae bacterium]